MLLQYALTLNKDTQAGLFFAKNLKETGKFNFGFGLKRCFDNKSILKAKLDDKLNAAVFYQHKLDNNFSLQTSVGKNFSDTVNANGFLGSEFSVGLKLKYDS